MDWDRKRTLDQYYKSMPEAQRDALKEKYSSKSDTQESKKEPINEQSGKVPFLKETTSTAMMHYLSSPMLQGRESGGEDTLPSHSATTPSSEGSDAHTHIARYDDAGNGVTAPDKTGHTHVIRSFAVCDYQSPDGAASHRHYGLLPVPAKSGTEYLPGS